MKLLIDECIPRKFKLSLSGHDCVTVREAGWAGKRNGDLLALADQRFDIFVTLDKSIEYQQNLAARKIAVLVIRARSNRLVDVRVHASACLSAIEVIRPGQIIYVPPRK